MTQGKVWVLWHMYGDGSGAHIERVYINEQRAREDLALLKSATQTSEWKVDEAPIISAKPSISTRKPA